MARPLRPLVAGGVYHVTSRGNQKQAIYRDDADRLMFLREVTRTVDRFGWLCLSYCLMENHFHLLLKTPLPNLSRGMQVLKSAYSQAFNRRHRRTDHLFGGRFGSVLIQQDAHLLEVFRYVALNPVRADSPCDHPGEWRWSAHAALAGNVPAPDLLAVAEALSYFAESRAAAVYEAFVAEARDVTYEPKGAVFGDQEFKRSVLPPSRPDREHVERDWGEGRPPLAELLTTTPGPENLVRAYREFGYTLGQIAGLVGCHPATVSRRIRAHEDVVFASKI